MKIAEILQLKNYSLDQLSHIFVILMLDLVVYLYFLILNEFL